jgi:tetratricopeptide (TPR) repeat protein
VAAAYDVADVLRSPAEDLMRIVAFCSLVLAATFALGAPAQAKEPGWCATYRNGGNNCGFNTHEQCMAAVSGVGGFCNRSPYAEPEKPAARKEREAEPKARRKDKEVVKERVAPAPKPVPPPAAAQPAPVIVQPPPAQVPVVQQPASNFQSARALILSGKYEAGIAAMKSLGFDDHPDIASSIGFAYAKLGNASEARAWYNRALAADPNHMSTLVYSGTLYVAQGDLAKARGDLDRIKAICGAGACSESQELESQIAAKSR